MSWLWVWLKDEWGVISSAPFVVASFVFLASLIVFGALRWAYGSRIEKLRSERDLFKAQAEDARAKAREVEQRKNQPDVSLLEQQVNHLREALVF